MGNAVYNVMYKLNGWIASGTSFKQKLSGSDIVSIAIINQYDTATYPIIRVRVYADMNLIENLNENPDDTTIGMTLTGGVYKTDKDTNTTSLVYPTDEISISGYGYIENKNIPVSKFDQFKMGLRDSTDLNVDSKVPFEIYIFWPEIIYAMRSKTHAVYRDSTVGTVCEDILMNLVGLPENKITIDPIQNQKRYDQILIPNLTAIDAFSYFDHMYGLYPHGGLLYMDHQNQMYLSDTSAYNGTTTIPIYVRSEKNDGMTESGMFYSGGIYQIQTQAINVSVLTESDIERVLNPERLSSINLNTLQMNYTDLNRLKDSSNISRYISPIEQKNILHKTDRSTLTIQEAARLDERITRVDISCAGIDVSLFKPNSRVNLVFESPIRGLKIADAYRICYATHVLSNTSGELFSPQTVMKLCTN